MAAASPCTENALAYMRILAATLHPDSRIAQVQAHLRTLQVEQLLRLTWFLGAYAIGQNAKAQKIAGLMHLHHAIPMVEASATVLLDWPNGFHSLLDQLGARKRLEASGNKLTAHFGRFYPTLYKSFPESPFMFLREGFERYLRDHWSGQLAKRHRRFSSASRDSHEWVSIKEAAKILRMRTTNVKELVEKGTLIGQFFLTASGRKMGSVRKDSVTAATVRQANLVTLAEAREISGLSKKRLHKLIGQGELRATRGPQIDGYPVWQFERSALEAIAKLLVPECNQDSQKRDGTARGK